MRRVWNIVFCLLLVLPLAVQADDLCTEGVLLFREDFGGNNPEDPVVSTTPVPGMSSRYTQVTNLETKGNSQDMNPGCYLVTKQGYRNSYHTNYSVWHIMDDHTYPNDKTRGYMLEIDATGGNDPFYQTTLSGLCEGAELSFFAYVVNLTTAGQYDGWRDRNYQFPKLSFVISNPQTGAEIARLTTDTISHDWSLRNTSGAWQYSATWQPVGMNFTVPVGINSLHLSIYNSGSGGTGNDFALDDIEVRLCITPEYVLSDTLVCDTTRAIHWRGKTHPLTDTLLDTVRNSCGFDSIYYILNVATEHCYTTLCTDGILLFREDFGGNDPSDPRVSTAPVQGMTYTQLLTDEWRSMGSGKYLVTKSGYCNGDTSITNLPQNRNSQWHLQDDHTYPNDKTRGYLLEIDGRGDNAAFYKTTIDNLCEGIELTFSAYVANVMTWGMYVGSPGRYAYPRLIFKLTNPVNNTELTTYDTGDIPFDSTFINDYSCWKQSSRWNLVGMNFTVPVGVESIQLSIYNNATGYIGNDFAIDDIEIHLCMTPDTIRSYTIVCDTIDQIEWRGKTFAVADTLRDTVFSNCGFDSIYHVMHVTTEHCEPPLPPCPDLLTITADTVVCDTLMPYRWRDTLFIEPAKYEILYKDQRDCDSVIYILRLDTAHCERPEPPTPPDPPEPPDPPTPPVVKDTIYPIIVNKYNWQLLLDYTAFRTYFPERTATAFQWYKNQEAVPDATEDDFAETQRLEGVYQLRVTLNDSKEIWSNSIEVTSKTDDEPLKIQIFNSRGEPINASQATHGLYLYQYEQGGHVWTEKKIVK